jgi:hypothetical protein
MRFGDWNVCNKQRPDPIKSAARIVYHLLTTREPYDESKSLATTESYRLRQEASLRKRAGALGYKIIPIQSSMNVVP